MLFKKEFDIDKDFFTEKPRQTPKRQVALRVFISVMVLTFFALCYCAFTFNFNMKFGSNTDSIPQEGLKEAGEYFFQAVKYYDSGDWAHAVEYLKKQLSIVDDPDAYNYLAKIYTEQGNIDLAIYNYKKALEFNPDFFEPNFELGKIYFALNDFRTASKYLTAASSQQLENTEVLSLTADTYKMIGKSDEAIILFEKILEVDPSSSFANTKIGDIYFQKLKYKSASLYYEEALKFLFDNNTALKLSKCYLELDNLPSALSLVNEVISDDKENQKAQNLKRAIEYKLLNNKKTAEEKIKNEIVQTRSEQKIDQNALNSYIKEIETPIKMNWTPPEGSNFKKASIKFTVDKEGELTSSSIYSSSGMADFDESALEAIELSKPFPPLPEALNRESLDIVFTFDFNVKN